MFQNRPHRPVTGQLMRLVLCGISAHRALGCGVVVANYRWPSPTIFVLLCDNFVTIPR